MSSWMEELIAESKSSTLTWFVRNLNKRFASFVLQLTLAQSDSPVLSDVLKKLLCPADRQHLVTSSDSFKDGTIAVLEQIDLVLSALVSKPSLLMEAVFPCDMKPWRKSDTVFESACKHHADELVVRFLDLIDDRTEAYFDEKWIVNQHNYRKNPFYVIGGLREETIKTMIDRIPVSKRLVSDPEARATESSSTDDADGSFVRMPLTQMAMKAQRDDPVPWHLAARALVIHGGANVDLKWVNVAPLQDAINTGNVRMVETLLRLGCRTDWPNGIGWSVLPRVLQIAYRDPESRERMRTILEMLLAFGMDLRKEPILCTLNSEAGPTVDARNRLHPDWLEALKRVRRSNETFTLKRMCRQVIRTRLKPKADETIRDWNDIPYDLREYLLVKNEPSILNLS